MGRHRLSSSSRRGAAMVEYALMLVLVAAVVIGAVVLMGDATRSSFSGVASKTGGLASLDHSVAAEHKHAAEPEAKPIAPPAEASSPLLSLLLVGLLGILGVSYLTMARKTRQATELPEWRASLPEIPEADLFAKRRWIWKLFEDDTRNLLENNMSVRQIMTTDLLTAEPSAPISEVTSLMASRRCRHMLVCNVDRLVGIISDRDLRGRKGQKASDIMTRMPTTVEPDMQVFQAITLMIKNSISCLPIVESDHLVGVLTTTDLLMVLQCSLRLLQQKADGYVDVVSEKRGRRISDLIAMEEAEAAAAEEAAAAR